MTADSLLSSLLPLLTPIVMLLALALLFGGLLGFAAPRFRVEGNPLVDRVNALLPQTQCGQCGHPGCKPYAAAIAAGGPINKCPPGGKATIAALADLLGVAAEPLDATHGVESSRKVAYIREAECIGCTKCIQACPVDAILGAANRDADHYDNPDEFRLDRGRGDHHTFGHGIHFCIGAPLGRLEARYALEGLFRRYKSIRHAEQASNERTHSSMLRGFHHLWFEVEPA